MRKIRIGTRRSDLALKQTEMVVNAIKKKFPHLETEIVIKVTRGDKSSAPLSSFGGKGVFVEEFQDALLMNDIDIAVHSAKDMPMRMPDGLSILGVLPRGDVREVLVYLAFWCKKAIRSPNFTAIRFMWARQVRGAKCSLSDCCRASVRCFAAMFQRGFPNCATAKSIA